MGLLTKEIERAPCTVEISHCFESLHAHVRFNNGAVIYPGDEVKVQGPEIMAPFGEIVREDREATIVRASKLERLWTRWTGDIEVMVSMLVDPDGHTVCVHSTDTRMCKSNRMCHSTQRSTHTVAVTSLWQRVVPCDLLGSARYPCWTLP